ncbi:hypothetical protein [Streptomyces sp. STCH 565 A]|uniref:hypothetical protein n=1 Tax=Streptomyces sp. STCH 565 A TaxID=2950532 RepID=UPI002075C7FB|nr:hypothetical protein [Streptomyces sp. STCH 565 A]MCM8555456.1 hypothetical protein [Streptomyces sp. STCH 565 A]
MIPATVPTEAILDRGKLPHESRPVHAWDDEGEPLVLWRNDLRRARNIEGFKEVRERRQIVGVVPGGGWMTEWQDPDEGTSFADPVVAWAVYSDGEARAIDTDSAGEACLLFPSDKDRRTYHPGQIPAVPLPGDESPGTSKENG